MHRKVTPITSVGATRAHPSGTAACSLPAFAASADARVCAYPARQAAHGSAALDPLQLSLRERLARDLRLTHAPFSVRPEGDRIKRFTSAIALLAVLAVAQPTAAVDSGPVHQCGTFVSYKPATATGSGELVIGSTTYATSSGGIRPGSSTSSPGPFNQVIAPGATIGSQVCLDGTIANSQTTANLLTDFTLTPAPVATTAPAAATTPAAAAPSALPSTNSQTSARVGDLTFVWLLLALGILSVVALLIARNRRATTD